MGSHKDTLLLPKTTLPINANLPANEQARYVSWDEGMVYERMKRDGNNPFILHDGPPYANDDIHVGHALNKILKDFIVKSAYFDGRAVEFVPGWDCHGLPIEQKVLLAARLGGGNHPTVIENIKNPLSFRRWCRGWADKQIEKQREQFKRLGVLADWDHPYKTMDASFESMIYDKLTVLAEKGLVFQRKKPVYWSWAEGTALAEAEIEYKERISQSIYVVFPTETEGFLVWTTTPWTLPANVAIALNPEMEYVTAIVKGWKNPLVVAAVLYDELLEKGIVTGRQTENRKGKEFEGRKVKHPIYPDQVVPVVMADFVSGESGTGCVHIAPGHGVDDYQIALKYDLPIVMPVGPTGHYNEGKYADESHFGGKWIYEDDTRDADNKPTGKKKCSYNSNKVILDDLGDRLIHTENITHNYPYCSRSDTPVIFRATTQFFLDLEKLRPQVLKSLESAVFYPDSSRNRMQPMLLNRPDWCISRQRRWGVPIAFIRNKKTGELQLDPGVLAKTKEILSHEGIDVWSVEGDERKPSYFQTPEVSLEDENWEKVTDILDVWFDSGLTWNILDGRKADVVVEGNDQHRGWFQSSLWLSVALTGDAPYKKVVTHGFVVDKDGLKMSKRKKNVVNPLDVVKKYGAEVLRYWVATTDYTREVSVGDEILERAAEGYRKLRNTFRFMLSNINGKPSRLFGELFPADRWILDVARDVFADVRRAFGDFEFYRGMQKLTEFLNGDLNSIYFNAVKDRLYCDELTSHSRNCVVFVLAVLLESFLGLVAPLFTYTADEVFSHAPDWFKDGRRDIFDFVYSPIPEMPKYEFVNYLDGDYWKRALAAFHAEFAKLKESGTVKDTLEVVLENKGKPKYHFFPKSADWFCVSDTFSMPSNPPALAEFMVDGDVYRIVKSTKDKCERCWKRNGSLCRRCEKSVKV